MALQADLLKQSIKPAIKESFEAITGYRLTQDNFVKIEDNESVPDEDAFRDATREADRRAEEIAEKLSTELAEKISNWLISGTEVKCTILSNTIATAGSPAAQAGPTPFPLDIAGTIS